MLWFNKKPKNNGTFSAYYTRVEGALLALEDECPSIAWASLKNHILSMIQEDKEKSIKLFESLDFPIEQWTKQVVFNVSSHLVSTGRYHVFRGLLNMEGQELLKIYHFVSELLVKDGVITKTWAKDDNEKLLEIIDSVG